MTGKFDKSYLKYCAFNLEFDLKVLPVSFGLLILSIFGEIFLYLFDIR